MKTVNQPAPVQAPVPLKTINSLVLFSFRTKQPATTKLNRRAGVQAAINNGASRNAARLYNRFLESRGTVIGKISTLFNQTSKKMRERALPNASGGYYLRAKDVDHVQGVFDEALNELDHLKQELLNDWEQLPRPELGQFAQDIKMPSKYEFADAYHMELDWMRQPAAIEGTVLEGVSTETAARVRAESQKSTERSLIAAHAEPVRETLKMLTGAIDHLATGKRLRSERFKALQDQIGRLDDMNWLDLPELKQLTNTLRPCVIDTDQLEDSTDKHKAVSTLSEAQRIAEQTLKDLGI